MEHIAPAQKSAPKVSAPEVQQHIGEEGFSEFSSLSGPESGSLMQLQAAADASPQVQEFRELQEKVTACPMQQEALQRKETLEQHSHVPLDNKGGLPDGLRAGIEELSGMDMSDVRVHRNSSKAGEAGALAYAQGTDIHLGPGQEQHLPHEAWHVVQQRQGRVKPTTEAPNGAAVNDDAGLEQEADVMGVKAMQMRPVGKAIAENSVSDDSTSSLQRQVDPEKDTMQRIVSMVEPTIDEKINDSEEIETTYKIGTVKVIGRPEKLFSNSMGDHTTAFSVHAEGLKMQLAGKTFLEGFAVLQNFYDDSKKLPGYLLYQSDLKEEEEEVVEIKEEENLEKEDSIENKGLFEIEDGKKPKQKKRAPHFERFKKAENELIELLKTDASAVTIKVISNFQIAVNTFLEFRELVPLSGINVMHIAPALAGKGKGEANKVDVLREHQGGKKKDSNALGNAILALFDFKSVAMALCEDEPSEIKIVAPGLEKAGGLKEKMKSFILQHLQSINTAFPQTFSEQFAMEDVGKPMYDKLLLEVEILIEGNYQELFRRYKIHLGLEEQAKNSQDKTQYGRDNIESTKESVNNVEEKLKEVFQQYVEAFEKDCPMQKEFETFKTDLEKLQKEGKKRERKEKVIFEIKHEKRVQKPKLETNSLEKKKDLDEEIQVDPEEEKRKKKEETNLAEKKEEEELEKEEKNSPLGVQIFPKDGLVVDIKFGGRPTSPFKGTMGAHSTAYIVHVDGILKACKGKTFAEAIGNIAGTSGSLMADALQMDEYRAEVNYGFEDENEFENEDEIEEGIKIEDEIEDQEPSLLDTAKEKVTTLQKTPIPDDDDVAAMFLLTKVIDAYLSYVNLIPGSTNETGSNNDGKGEANAAKILRSFEEGSSISNKDLREAIKKLFDLAEDTDESIRSNLKRRHKTFIQHAYPEAYKKLYWKSKDSEKEKKVIKPSKKDEGKQRLNSELNGGFLDFEEPVSVKKVKKKHDGIIDNEDQEEEINGGDRMNISGEFEEEDEN